MNSTDTMPIRRSTKRDSNGASRRRGARCITLGSVGSNARTSASVTPVIVLIHSICTGVIGKASPSRIASTTESVCPPLVGSVQTITLRILS